MAVVTRLVLVAFGSACVVGTAAAAIVAKPLPVSIKLSDSGFGFRNVAFRAPVVRLDIVNEGTKEYGLAIVGTGRPTQDVEIEAAPLASRQSTELTLRLSTGNYEIFSPVDYDRARTGGADEVPPVGAGRTEMNRVFYNYRPGH